MTTPLLGLSEIAEGVVNQATIHNTALRQLEALLVRALSKSTMAPPSSSASGDSYIVPTGATGVWSGKTNQIAAFIGGAWSYFAPSEGIRLWINDVNAEFVFDGAAWIANGGDSSADAAAAVAAHEAESDPHPQYLTQTEGDARYTAAGSGATYTNFGPSGASHASGLVPDPGATAGTTKYLREDGTWSLPPGAGGGTGAAVYVSDTAPSSPVANQLWWRSDIGQLFVYYNDGTSSQWVQASPGVPGPQGTTGAAGPAGPTGAAGGLFGGQLYAAPALSSWTQRNIASTATVADSSVGPRIADQVGAGPRIRALTMAAPSAPYTIDVLLSADLPWANYVGTGICFTDGTRYQAFLAGYTTTVPAGPNIRIANFSSTSAYASDATAAQAWFFNPSLLWMRIRDDGTTIYFYRSSDGVNWNLRYSVAKSSGYLGASGYSNIGFFLDAEGTAQSGTTQNCSVTLMSWKQN